MLNSDYLSLCAVKLPPFRARQHYMHAFEISKPSMPFGFEEFIKPVQDLCGSARVKEGTVFVTVDEAYIVPGRSQRRPGPHVDGCFIPQDGRWSHGPGWNHYCNNIPIARMPVIVASSLEGCRAWRGYFDTEPKNDGDLSHISDQLGEGVLLSANRGYLLSPDCVHESIVFTRHTRRTFLRVAVPPEFAPNYWN